MDCTHLKTILLATSLLTHRMVFTSAVYVLIKFHRESICFADLHCQLALNVFTSYVRFSFIYFYTSSIHTHQSLISPYSSQPPSIPSCSFFLSFLRATIDNLLLSTLFTLYKHCRFLHSIPQAKLRSVFRCIIYLVSN